MSRTYRCKNFEAESSTHSWTSYTRAFGWYTEYDIAQTPWHGHRCELIYRAPTKKELWFKVKHAHADRGRAHFNPPNWFRRVETNSMNMQHKEEVLRWMRDPDYEVQCVPWSRCQTWWS